MKFRGKVLINQSYFLFLQETLKEVREKLQANSNEDQTKPKKQERSSPTPYRAASQRLKGPMKSESSEALFSSETRHKKISAARPTFSAKPISASRAGNNISESINRLSQTS